MITVQKSEDRGQADHGWLKTYHSFSFASYFNPKQMKYRALRALNEDWVQGNTGFTDHPHENMEILTYIIKGQLEHKDSMGNGAVIHAGEVQRMSAGTGITHSEFNPTSDITHLFQIWIYPERIGLEPDYEQRDFLTRRPPNHLTLLASQTGRDNSLMVHQDLELYCGLLDQNSTLEQTFERERHIWIQMISGAVDINGTHLQKGDGAAVEDEATLSFSAQENSEFLLFNLA